MENKVETEYLNSDIKFMVYNYTSNETFLRGKLMSEMRQESLKF